jgi:hypothetical protein
MPEPSSHNPQRPPWKQARDLRDQTHALAEEFDKRAREIEERLTRVAERMPAAAAPPGVTQEFHDRAREITDAAIRDVNSEIDALTVEDGVITIHLEKGGTLNLLPLPDGSCKLHFERGDMSLWLGLSRADVRRLRSATGEMIARAA